MARQKNIELNQGERPHLPYRPVSQPSPIFGLLVMAAGLYPLLLGLQVVKASPGSVHAPLWVIGAVGATFMMGGLSCFLQSLGLPRTSPVFGALAAIVALGLLTPFAWLVFGNSGVDIIGRLLFAMPFAVIFLIVAAVFLIPGEVKIIDPETGEVRKVLRIGRKKTAINPFKSDKL